MLDRFDAFIIEADVNRKNRLKTAAMAITTFKKVEGCSDCNVALNHLGQKGQTGVIFISGEVPHEEVKSFIERGKKTAGGEDCAYVVVLRSAEKESELASIILLGAHAFICEPYSVDRLNEIVEISRKVRKENEVARKKAAISLLIATVIREFDKLALYISRGLNAEHAKRKFRETCGALQQFQDESLKAYTDIAVAMFEEVKAPPKLAYSGPSKRIKEKMEQKLREEYAKEFGTSADLKTTEPSTVT